MMAFECSSETPEERLRQEPTDASPSSHPVLSASLLGRCGVVQQYRGVLHVGLTRVSSLGTLSLARPYHGK